MVTRTELEKCVQALCPAYAILKQTRSRTHENTYGGSSNNNMSVLGWVFGVFIIIFLVFVPAIQAFQCQGQTSLYFPGWLWGIGILFFWPLGFVWAGLRGTCPATGEATAAMASGQHISGEKILVTSSEPLFSDSIFAAQ